MRYRTVVRSALAVALAAWVFGYGIPALGILVRPEPLPVPPARIQGTGAVWGWDGYRASVQLEVEYRLETQFQSVESSAATAVAVHAQ